MSRTVILLLITIGLWLVVVRGLNGSGKNETSVHESADGSPHGGGGRTFEISPGVTAKNNGETAGTTGGAIMGRSYTT